MQQRVQEQIHKYKEQKLQEAIEREDEPKDKEKDPDLTDEELFPFTESQDEEYVESELAKEKWQVRELQRLEFYNEQKA